MTKLTEAIIRKGYSWCFTESPNRLGDLWCKVWFYFFCPYPISSNQTASHCVKSGHCGCNNSAGRTAINMD